MKESTTSQATVAEGEERALLRLGRKPFGPTDIETEAAIEAHIDPDRAEKLLERFLDARSWSERLGHLNGEAATR